MNNDFEINEMDLDGDWLQQSILYNKWAVACASAIKTRKTIELQRKIIKAQVYKDAKIAFEAVGKKPTANDLEAEVRTNEKYLKLSEQLINAEEQENIMDAGKWSMVEKSKSLDRLCEDRDKGFFMPSGSSPKTENRRQEQLKDIDKGLREQMQNKRINRG